MKYSVKNIPANLKKYRLEHHKKQVEMAYNILFPFWNNFDNSSPGKQPSLQKFVEVCEKLHVAPNDLLKN